MATDTSDAVMEQVAEVLVELEHRAKVKEMSDAKVAAAAGMDRSDVSKLLHGRNRGIPKLVVLARVAHALGYKLRLVLSRLVP